MTNGNTQQETAIVPLQVTIKALGSRVELNSNSNDPKMVILALIEAMKIVINQSEVKPESKVKIASPFAVSKFGGHG